MEWVRILTFHLKENEKSCLNLPFLKEEREERKSYSNLICVIGLQRFTVPQRFFRHFYWVAVVWTTLLLGSTWMYANYTAQLVSEVSEPLLYSNIASYLTGGSHISSWSKSHSTSIKQRFMIWRSVFLLLLMEVQVLRRLVETIYVFNYSPSARMHILGYLTGLL